MRHAAHYLKAQSADKKLMLILTDGEPSDIYEDDDQLLIRDARQAVKELDRLPERLPELFISLTK